MTDELPEQMPERIWIQRDVGFFHTNGNGTYYREPDPHNNNNSVEYVRATTPTGQDNARKAQVEGALRMAQKVCHERFCDSHPMGQSEVCKELTEAIAHAVAPVESAARKAAEEIDRRIAAIAPSERPAKIASIILSHFPAGVAVDARIRCREMTPERWEELQTALDRPTGPTEEEAEEVLQHCNTSGKEVVNGFIEQLMRENLELKQRLAVGGAVPTRADSKCAELIACGVDDDDPQQVMHHADNCPAAEYERGFRDGRISGLASQLVGQHEQEAVRTAISDSPAVPFDSRLTVEHCERDHRAVEEVWKALGSPPCDGRYIWEHVADRLAAVPAAPVDATQSVLSPTEMGVLAEYHRGAMRCANDDKTLRFHRLRLEILGSKDALKPVDAEAMLEKVKAMRDKWKYGCESHAREDPYREYCRASMCAANEIITAIESLEIGGAAEKEE